MNTTDYENIWKKSLIHITDEFALPPVVLQAGEAIIGTLGNFSVSTGKAKAKKTFIYVTDNNSARVKDGRLADVAPSLLHIMGLEQPEAMTGENLIEDK